MNTYITPHKGGRTETISLRFTPGELYELDRKRGDTSRSDYIMQLVNAAPGFDVGQVLYNLNGPDFSVYVMYAEHYDDDEDEVEFRFQANLDVYHDGMGFAADGWGEYHETLSDAIEECRSMFIEWLTEGEDGIAIDEAYKIRQAAESEQ